MHWSSKWKFDICLYEKLFLILTTKCLKFMTQTVLKTNILKMFSNYELYTISQTMAQKYLVPEDYS